MWGMFWYLGNWFIYENKFKNKSSVLRPALILIISSWFRPHSPELTIVSCSLYPPLCFKGGSGNLKWYFLDISPSRESWQQPVRPINNEDQPRGCVGGWECWRAPDKLHVVASGGQGGSGTRCTHTHTRRSRTHCQHFCNLHAAPSSLLSISKSHKLNLVFD